MQDLYAATEQSVQVGVLDGHETVYVERIFGHNAAKTLARPGGRLPFHVTSIGRVISAYSTVREVDTLLSEPLTKMTRHTVAEPGALRREAAEIRRNGYAITCRQVDLVSMSVAAPIRGPENSVVAAISIIVPVHGQAARTFVPTVVAAAHGISRTLGARPRPAVVTGAAA